MPRAKRNTSNDSPVIGEMDRPHCPRPREQKVIEDLASGAAKSISNALVRNGFNPGSGSLRNRFAPDGDLRLALEKKLLEVGMTQDKVFQTVASRLDAKRMVIVDKEAIMIDDNDAQLRAAEIAIKLHDRTGKLPAMSEVGAGGSSITVNVLVMPEAKKSE